MAKWGPVPDKTFNPVPCSSVYDGTAQDAARSLADAFYDAMASIPFSAVEKTTSIQKVAQCRLK